MSFEARSGYPAATGGTDTLCLDDGSAVPVLFEHAVHDQVDEVVV